ncbi:MAG: AEC family transporter, partial [Bacteroidales bacterium]|nr:AEC family transporter [Bacteroidales bacterium]
AFGEEGLSRILIMDLGNGILVFTFIYYQACKYGSAEKDRNSSMILKFVKAPPVWAILGSLVLNFAEFPPSGVLLKLFEITGDLTIPLLMLSVGIFFEPRIIQARALFSIIIIRMGFGLALGWFAIELLGLDGLTGQIVLLGSATPVGYNTLTFSSVENLDRSFASAVVSISVLAAIIWYPILIYLII